MTPEEERQHTIRMYLHSLHGYKCDLANEVGPPPRILKQRIESLRAALLKLGYSDKEDPTHDQTRTNKPLESHQ